MLLLYLKQDFKLGNLRDKETLFIINILLLFISYDDVKNFLDKISTSKNYYRNKVLSIESVKAASALAVSLFLKINY